MKFYQVETDLPTHYGPQTLLIIQPKATTDIEWQDLYRRDDKFFSRALNDVIALCGFTHVSTMNYRIGFNTKGALVEITEYQQCHGEISFLRHKGVINSVVCPGCQRKIGFYHSNSSKVVHQTTLFFLALKQMFPKYPSCNFLNLFFDLSIELELFGGLGPGLISMGKDVLSVNNRLCDIGFTLKPGLDPNDDQEFAQLIKWIRVLVYKWTKVIGTAIDDQKFFALGPKSTR